MKTIFILEDDFDIRFILEMALTTRGFSVTCFENILQFSEGATIVPDLYLLDINLPDGSGLDVCYELKAKKITEDTPVILMSAINPSNELWLSFKANAFINKPFDLNKLVDEIQMHV